MVATSWQKICVNKRPAVGRRRLVSCFGAASLLKGKNISRTSHFKVSSAMNI